MICRDTSVEDSLLRRSVKVPTAEEDIELLEIAQQGDISARNELIVRHLPIMMKMANENYVRHGRPMHVEVEDLIHVAVFGMIRAINKYDKNKARGRFIAYAKYWIRHFINVAINDYRMYRIPLSTKYAYKTGRSADPDTQRAIDNFRHIGYMQSGDGVLDDRSSPEEEAIINEEFERVKR